MRQEDILESIKKDNVNVLQSLKVSPDLFYGKSLFPSHHFSFDAKFNLTKEFIDELVDNKNKKKFFEASGLKSFILKAGNEITIAFYYLLIAYKYSSKKCFLYLSKLRETYLPLWDVDYSSNALSMRLLLTLLLSPQSKSDDFFRAGITGLKNNYKNEKSVYKYNIHNGMYHFIQECIYSDEMTKPAIEILIKFLVKKQIEEESNGLLFNMHKALLFDIESAAENFLNREEGFYKKIEKTMNIFKKCIPSYKKKEFEEILKQENKNTRNLQR